MAKRLLKRSRERFEAQYREQVGYYEPQWQRFKAAERLELALWERCKREAIDAAVGIA